MPSSSAKPATDGLSLQALLARVGDELGDVARRTDDLQVVIGALLEAIPDRGLVSIHPDLQQVDSIGQRLGRLVELVRAIEVSIQHDWRLDPTRLDAGLLAAALGRLDGAGGRNPGAGERAAGECDLF